MNYVIGDSHVSIFSGQNGLNKPDLLPKFRTHNISARLAYNFGKNDHPVTIAVDKVLKDIPVGSPVIFSFGEIDCRCHIWDEVAKGTALQEAIGAAVDQYVKGVEHYLNRGFNVYALLPHVIKYKPKGIESAVGTWSQITAASKLFNEAMTKWNEDRCISLFDWTYEYEVYMRSEYYLDDTHLSQMCLPYMLAEVQKRGLEI